MKLSSLCSLSHVYTDVAVGNGKLCEERSIENGESKTKEESKSKD